MPPFNRNAASLISDALSAKSAAVDPLLFFLFLVLGMGNRIGVSIKCPGLEIQYIGAQCVHTISILKNSGGGQGSLLQVLRSIDYILPAV
jgi:hypothetical protein